MVSQSRRVELPKRPVLGSWEACVWVSVHCRRSRERMGLFVRKKKYGLVFKKKNNKKENGSHGAGTSGSGNIEQRKSDFKNMLKVRNYPDLRQGRKIHE